MGRWDEIRKEPGTAHPSSWDEIRQSHERVRVQPSNSPPAEGVAVNDRHKEQAKFDALLEAERKISETNANS